MKFLKNLLSIKWISQGVAASILLLSIYSCTTITGLKSDHDKAAAIKKLKRGKIIEGLYINEFYEFEFSVPKEWKAKIGDPPVVVRITPPATIIRDASARKLISIQALIQTKPAEQDLEAFIRDYIKRNHFEMVSKKRNYILNTDSIVCVVTGNEKGQPVRFRILFAELKDNAMAVIRCKALGPLYDNVDAQFRLCTRTFKFTGKSLRTPTPTPNPDPFAAGNDWFPYTVQPGDTGTSIAKEFMGTEDRAWVIIQYNELEDFKQGLKLKIPRFFPYRIQPGEDAVGVAKKLLGDGKFSKWILNYNKDTQWKANASIRIPLYQYGEILPREGYVHLAKRLFNKPELADLLLTFNGNQPLSSMKYVRLPIFLLSQYYEYRVRPGDTLASIAGRLTGNSKNFKIIAEVNNIPSPYSLSANQIIKIPRRLVKDPSLLTKPAPKPKRRARAKKRSKPKTKPKAAGTPTPIPTSTPIPPPDTVDSDGMYEPI